MILLKLEEAFRPENGTRQRHVSRIHRSRSMGLELG